MNEYYELNNDTIIEYIKQKVDFFAKDAELSSVEIGDGNLNLVFRISESKTGKSIIVKQALPYVRASGGDWPLDIGRGEIEKRILDVEYKLTDGAVPEVFFYDEVMCCMAMEDLSDYIIMRYGLLKYEKYPEFPEQISDYIVKSLLFTSDVVMDHKEKKQYVKDFINPELCEITEQLVYTEPFFIGARNSIEDSIVDFHKENIAADEELRLEVAKLKFDFMNNAQALLHGDLHTGSIFVNKENTKVIDPEFAFYGPIAYDLACVFANLIMNYISAYYSLEEQEKRDDYCNYLKDTIIKTVDLTKEKFIKYWDDAVTDQSAKVPGFKEYYINDIFVNAAGIVGCEMTRRTVGFAHVVDLDGISDDKKRYSAKTNNLLLAKIFIIQRSEILTGTDYVEQLEKLIKEEEK